MQKRVLIVDDDLEQIEFASSLLEENGMIPIVAMDGDEGIRKAITERPELILLDILMPQKGGIAMIRELKENPETRDIPVIIITGISRGQDFEEKLLTRGFSLPPPYGYIEKPMKPEILLEMIKNVSKPQQK